MKKNSAYVCIYLIEQQVFIICSATTFYLKESYVNSNIIFRQDVFLRVTPGYSSMSNNERLVLNNYLTFDTKKNFILLFKLLKCPWKAYGKLNLSSCPK